MQRENLCSKKEKFKSSLLKGFSIKIKEIFPFQTFQHCKRISLSLLPLLSTSDFKNRIMRTGKLISNYANAFRPKFLWSSLRFSRSYFVIWFVRTQFSLFFWDKIISEETKANDCVTEFRKRIYALLLLLWNFSQGCRCSSITKCKQILIFSEKKMTTNWWQQSNIHASHG